MWARVGEQSALCDGVAKQRGIHYLCTFLTINITNKEFNLEEYLTSSVEGIVKGALRASLFNPKESIFMAKYALASKKASRLRHEAEKKGEHIPPFLIASIASNCNLHCAGCYSRAIETGDDGARTEQLNAESWGKVFREAAELGISFILLAGGEPLLRRDVIEEATAVPEILFPVFTNGTLLKDDYLGMFDKSRNLIPVLSIEGNRETTDKRRGHGVYQRLIDTMEDIDGRGILFGVSVTVTTRNLREVMSGEFIDDLRRRGCKLVIYVEYVPMVEVTRALAPGDEERAYMEERLLLLRSKYEDMVFISFPGDEKTSGGCLATGRGFFHINYHGGAEPCPFSPFSDANVKEVGVAGALHSRLFRTLRESGFLTEEHDGGCVLFRKEAQIRKLMGSIHS